jgi:membrane protein DedA with SNARE-associated domain
VDRLAEESARLVEGLFESYGYWVVFFGTFLENTLFLGLLVPGVLVMLLAGLSAHEGMLSLPVVIVLGIAGTVTGDTVSYVVGRLGWHRALTRLAGDRFNRWSEGLRQPIMRWSVLFVLFYHFAGYSRVVGPAAAGILRMPARRWVPLDYAGASLWVTTYVMAGYVLGRLGLTLDSTQGNFRIFEWLLFAAFVTWVIILAISAPRLLRQRRAILGQAPMAAGPPSGPTPSPALVDASEDCPPSR